MDTNTYCLQVVAEARLSEARALSARAALLASVAPARRGLSGVLALTLIRAGRWLGRRRAGRRRSRSLAPGRAEPAPRSLSDYPAALVMGEVSEGAVEAPLRLSRPGAVPRRCA